MHGKSNLLGCHRMTCSNLNGSVCSCCSLTLCYGTKKSGHKELWRLRLNWVFTASLSLLTCISIQSVTSSFHQFVTNPRYTGTGNGSQTTVRDYGLGESEQFYSSLIATLNIGAILGGVLSGLMVKCLPYWHLFLTALVAHIVGYVLYAVTYEGWVILISKFLAGWFIGSQRALALSYATSSSAEYVKALEETGQKVEENAAARIRDYLFSAQTIGICLGFFVGPGAALVFAQFPIDQFRAIAWFNVVAGALYFLMGFLLFRGEAKCDRVRNCSRVCTCRFEKLKLLTRNEIGPLRIFILIALFLLSISIAIKFALFETLYNPILSDSFGVTERGSPLFFLGLAIPEVVGVVFLFVLQKLKLSNQIIAIIGIAMTFVGCLLFGDWQAIPHDPCTDYSPYHHPEIINTLSNHSSMQHLRTVNVAPKISMHSVAQLNFQGRSFVVDSVSGEGDLQLSCEEVSDCSCRKSTLCLSATGLSKKQTRIQRTTATAPLTLLLCSSDSLAPLSVCLQYQGKQDVNESNTSSIQSIAVLPKSIYPLARSYCEEASTTDRRCHWISSSALSNRECDDCPAICRSEEQTLTFSQFAIGASILMASGPVSWVSAAAMISYQSPKEFQEIVMGAYVATVFFGRSIGPLILDAAYEGIQKRTFLAALLLIVIFLPFLVEVIVLYRRLGPRSEKKEKQCCCCIITQ